jgi:hypothetical protein
MASYLMTSFFLAASALPTALAATFDVSVGDGALRFNPEFVTANPGDIVNFVLYVYIVGDVFRSLNLLPQPPEGAFSDAVLLRFSMLSAYRWLRLWLVSVDYACPKSIGF